MPVTPISKGQRRTISELIGLFFLSLYELWFIPHVLAELLEGKSALLSFLLIIAIGILIVAIAFFVLTAKITNKLWDRLAVIRTNFLRAFFIFWQVVLGREPYSYTVIDRGKDEFKQEISKKIRDSKMIYFLLLSAYTMFYDEREKFVFETLLEFNRKEIQDKNIKILLLNRECKQFVVRGRWFVKKMKRELASFRVDTYEEYVTRCKQNEEELREIVKHSNLDAIQFYASDPIWRLHIFDNVVYASIYTDDMDGHLTSLFRFEKEAHSTMYLGLLKVFDNLYYAS